MSKYLLKNERMHTSCASPDLWFQEIPFDKEYPPFIDNKPFSHQEIPPDEGFGAGGYFLMRRTFVIYKDATSRCSLESPSRYTRVLTKAGSSIMNQYEYPFERESVCVCERERLCVCVCERERERERDCVISK